MNIYTLIAYIGGLILLLSRPVASANNWAFDTESCSGFDLDFTRMQMLRATTIAKNAASWLPRAPSLSTKPNFAQALLGKNYAFAARSVFNGGSLSWRSGKSSVKGVSSLTGETGWASARRAGNVLIYCNAANLAQSSNFPNQVVNRAADSTYTGVLPLCDDTIRPDSPVMITHYDESASIDYIFICPWWLRVNELAMASSPYQPWDTRLTVYDTRFFVQLNQVNQHGFKMWRNAALIVPPDLQGSSDVALSWAAADIQFLNALTQTSFGGVRESKIDGGNAVFSYGRADWPLIVEFLNQGGGYATFNLATSTPFVYIALAILNYQSGFNIDLNTGNYIDPFLSFNPRIDYAAPDRTYRTEPRPPPYPMPPPYAPPK